jgi:hypothetical protein
MSLASIEARAAELMAMHKDQLTRAIAHFEHITGHLWDEAEGEVKRLLGLGDEPAQEPAPAMGQGTDPIVIEVPAASTEPELLEPAGAPVPPPIDDAHVAVGSTRFSDGQEQTPESLAAAQAAPATDTTASEEGKDATQ